MQNEYPRMPCGLPFHVSTNRISIATLGNGHSRPSCTVSYRAVLINWEVIWNKNVFGKIVFRNISKSNISFLKFMKSLYLRKIYKINRIYYIKWYRKEEFFISNRKWWNVKNVLFYKIEFSHCVVTLGIIICVFY